MIQFQQYGNEFESMTPLMQCFLFLLQVHTKFHLHVLLAATYSYQHITYAIYLIMLPWLISCCKKMCIYELDKNYKIQQA